MTAVRLSVSGMSCGGCQRGVQDALSSVPGVTGVDVSLERGEALVHGDAPAAVLVSAVQATGKSASVVEPAARTVKLAVSGMSCGGCVGSVQKALAAVEGVEDVNVSLDNGGAAEVRGIAFPGTLIAAVKTTGKDARVLDA